ncbi:gfo/Idh/MocA family oxidoreductase [Microbacterium bovistercoris]|uniref:Gfo/Idh/MocA family oxidoreductase n=1 Tax=Microbacterium bovistercoris TaxID=2293570 RepID=A0A371NRA2_9MICO|nr:Gfo/Idh/MocA family oxidoreductase [Microbacterium bovistercoris]REJ04239.1 gfo/Idh/MocA family oxidoreductase [Microbacterium bovistercoris]
MTTDVIRAAVGTIRAGILGAGFMARVHADATRAVGGDLVAIAASTPSRSALAATTVGAQRAALSADELIAAPDVDLVHVCTPNSTHSGFAAAALGAGKHVVCEKPLALSADDAARLSALAADSGRVAAVPFVYRYHPMVREARARVQRGALGALLTLDCAYLQDWMLLPTDDDWRASAELGGPSRAFADIGSHLCDLIEFVIGERIAALSARTRTVFGERDGHVVDNEDIAALLVQTASGAVGTVLISQMAAGRKNALTVELHGSHESIRFQQERPEELWIGGRTESRLLLRDPAMSSPDSARLQRVPAGHPMGYLDAFTSFMGDVHSAIAGEQPDGLPTFADGLRAAVLTEAVLASAAEGGRTVEVRG